MPKSERCVDLQHAANLGEADQREAARTISRLSAGSSVPTGPPPVARTPQEYSLGVHLAWQTSHLGQLHQALVTAASKVLAAAVGGHDSGSGKPIATVHLRLARQVHRAPGVWLLRRPLTDEQLANLPGASDRSTRPRPRPRAGRYHGRSRLEAEPDQLVLDARAPCM